MVKIFKRLNGSINAEVLKMVDPPSIADKVRKWIWPKDDIEPTFGMELIKSSLSATFTRETAQFFVNSAQSSALRLFMRKKQLMCPDEYFWLTLAGNPKSVKMPSNFDAARLLKDVERRREIEKLKGGSPSQQSIPYYISRYQRWIEKFNVIISSKPCAGKYIRFSCVFGVRDVSHLLQRPELVAHKFYITFQPAAFFCLNRKIKERALHGHSEFNDEPYGNLPGPRITRSSKRDPPAGRSTRSGKN
ncbi:unnamed protein product [Toxocara canis]|uniref:Retrotransposon protein, putative, unclassified n=1 Tax=Toxocara canis TaxID=6265 RepID=A0A183UJG0_TOXCA|nr:unnamed protein product [Toxocara canis]